MRKFLKVYENPFKDRINLPLIKRKLEGDLSEFVINVFKSLETIPYITFLDYSIERDESKIDYSKYIVSLVWEIRSLIKNYYKSLGLV